MASETVNREGTQLDEDGVWTTTEDGERVPNYDATFPTINEGEVVHGTVVRVDKDEVLVDIGYKSEGVIPVAELSIRRSVNPADEVSLGDEVDALVLTKEDAEGRLILSKKRARFEMAWKAIEHAAESEEPVLGRVIEVVKGGLILDLGVRGFLPASLVDIRRVQDLDEFLGQELRAKVIELNRSRNNVVLSRRAVLEDERKEMRQAILDRLNPGDVVDGQISNIVDFGAFVDLDGMDGLIHISELSWSHVNHPSEVLEIGQDVKVKVLDIDRERQRISLGLKQTQSRPVAAGARDLPRGRRGRGQGHEGRHLRRLRRDHARRRGARSHLRAGAAPRREPARGRLAGRLVKAKIIEVDAERRRLSLSLKRVEGGGVTERAEDSEAVEGTPNLDLSEEVFPEGRLPRPTQPEPEAEDQEPELEPAAEKSPPRRSLSPRSPADEPVAEAPRSSSRSRSARGRGRRSRRGAGARAGRRVRGRGSHRAARVAWRDRSPSPSPAASEPARARPSPPSRATARPSSPATRSSTACCGRTRRCATRCASGSATGSSTRRRDRPRRDRRDRLRRLEALDWLEALLHPLVVQEYMDWRERQAELDDPPSVTATEVPLLYEVGGEDRFDAVVVVTAPPEVRGGAHRGGRPRTREPRLLPDAVKMRRRPTSPTSTTARSRSWTPSCRR